MSDIQKFLNDISSLYWWIAVVIVGVAANIASSYLKSSLDNFYSRYSEVRRKKIESENREVEIEAGILAKDHRLLILKGIEEIRWMATSIFFLLLALIVASIGAYISKFSSGIAAYQNIISLLIVLVGLGLFTLAIWAFEHAANITLALLKARQNIYAQLIQLGEKHGVK